MIYIYIYIYIYNHYRQSPTNILDDKLHYKTHILFDPIIHASLTKISAIPIPVNPKAKTPQSALQGLPNTDNGAYGNEMLPFNTQVRRFCTVK